MNSIKVTVSLILSITLSCVNSCVKSIVGPTREGLYLLWQVIQNFRLDSFAIVDAPLMDPSLITRDS